MSAGLAYADSEGIHLAIDRSGVFSGLRSKLVLIDKARNFYLLVTGWLEPWAAAISSFQPGRKLEEAAEQLEGPLALGRQQVQQSTKYVVMCYGLLCGFEDGEPKCLRITCLPSDVSHKW